MKPYVIGFGPWLPDGADLAFGMPFQYSQTPVPLADVQNVYYSRGAYRSMPTLAAGNAAAAQVLNANTSLDDTGAPKIYLGTATDLYAYAAGAYTNVSKSAGAYAGTAFWSFVDFGGCIIGANGINLLQDMTVGGAAFADIAGSPIGRVVGSINQSLIVGDITSPVAYPFRVQWGGIGDPASWPTPLSDVAIAAQSGYEDLTEDFGRVMFIGGGPQMGVVLQRLGITRLQYVGGDVVFQFIPYERKSGLVAKGAAIQVNGVVHYISDDGFKMTDGSQVIGTGTSQSAALDKWFLNNVNMSALDSIRAAYDANLKLVMYAIPTGVNTLPDTLLLLNAPSGQWTKAAIPSECLWTDTDGTTHRAGAFDQLHHIAYFTGAPAAGYCETYDLSFVDGLIRDVPEAQPHIVCTDRPTMRIGSKRWADDTVSYTADSARNAFTGRCTWDPPPSALFQRARVTSSNASAINGATLYMTDGVPT